MLLNKSALFFHVATLCHSRLQHNIAPFEYTQLKKEILWIKLLALQHSTFSRQSKGIIFTDISQQTT